VGNRNAALVSSLLERNIKEALKSKHLFKCHSTTLQFLFFSKAYFFISIIQIVEIVQLLKYYYLETYLNMRYSRKKKICWHSQFSAAIANIFRYYMAKTLLEILILFAISI